MMIARTISKRALEQSASIPKQKPRPELECPRGCGEKLEVKGEGVRICTECGTRISIASKEDLENMAERRALKDSLDKSECRNTKLSQSDGLEYGDDWDAFILGCRPGDVIRHRAHCPHCNETYTVLYKNPIVEALCPVCHNSISVYPEENYEVGAKTEI